MSSDSSVINDFSRCPTASEIGAAPDACEGPPPLPVPSGSYLAILGFEDSFSPEAEGAEDAMWQPAPAIIADVPPIPTSESTNEATEAAQGQPHIKIPDVSVKTIAAVEPPVAQSPWRRLKLLAALIVSRCVEWLREDGYWYLTSMAAHALGLVSLAIISLAIPTAIVSMSRDEAPSFDAPKLDNSPAAELTRFQVGEAPLDPTELNAETLAETKALPIGGQEARWYDDDPVFEEAGGGIVTDMEGPKLGGLGFRIKDLPGPGGLGGVGVGVGLGKNPGSGGAGNGFGSRGKGHRPEILGPAGGTRASERAVGAALSWIARHQAPNGKWSLDFKHQCKGGVCSGTGSVRADTGATALALLPFLAAGETHTSKGPYKQTVAKGIAWLVKQQRSDGDLSGGCDQPMYSHGLATLALCEAYGMTRDEHIGTAARQAVAFIERAQNESTGGWRYQPGDPGDTSVFGWQIMALKSAQLAGLPVNSIVFDNAQKFLHSVAKGEHLGLYSYQPYREVTHPMTAVGMLCRQYLGVDPKDPTMLEGKEVLLQNLPENSLGRNTYYWYYATLAMHNFADAEWDTWNRRMRRALIETQVKEGCATGSWDPERPTLDAWGSAGGRLMTTSLSTLTLEVYYRYLPLFRTDSPIFQPQNQFTPAEQIDTKAESNNTKTESDRKTKGDRKDVAEGDAGQNRHGVVDE
jgi:hypothetical protein